MSSAALANVGAAIGLTTDFGIDIGTGAASVAQKAQKEESAGKKAYNITGDVLGIGANIATSAGINIGLTGSASGLTTGAGAAVAGTGAAGVGGTGAAAAGGATSSGAAAGGVVAAVGLIVAQIVGLLLDSLWGPFKNYFNSDLELIRNTIKTQLRNEFFTKGLNWPLEVKPNIIGFLTPNDPDYEKNLNEFKDYVKKYYEDRGIITEEEVLAEEQLFLDILQLKRQNKKFRQDENGNLTLLDPSLSAVELQDSDNNNMLLLLALAVYAKKNRLVKNEQFMKQRQQEQFIYKSKDFMKYNWQMIVSIISVLALFFFCSISIIGIVKK